MKKIILFLFVGIAINSFAQSTLLWSNDFKVDQITYYNNTPSVQTFGDTIRVVGEQKVAFRDKLLIVNYGLDGDTISVRTYGDDGIFSSSKLIDYEFDSEKNVYLLHQVAIDVFKDKTVVQKYTLNGDLIWIDHIESMGDSTYIPNSLALINDSTLFVTAYRGHDPNPTDDVISGVTEAFLNAYDTDGNFLWRRWFDSNSEVDRFTNELIAHSNSAFLFTIHNSINLNLVKVDADNNLTVHLLDGIPIVNEIKFTQDDNIVISGRSPYELFKLNLNGEIIWFDEYPTNNPYSDEIQSISFDTDGNIYVTGRHYGEDTGPTTYTNADILTIKYDPNGNILWENRYQHGINNADIGNSITVVGEYVYVGGNSQGSGLTTDYDYVVLKMDKDSGETEGIYRYNGAYDGDDGISDLAVLENGDIAITGLSEFGVFEFDLTTQLLSDIIISVEDTFLENQVSIYPNPINKEGKLKINGSGFNEYTISSVTGQVIQKGKINSFGSQTITLNHFNSGIFFLNLSSENKMYSQKFIIK